MYIPKTMNNAVANTFYDKTVEILNNDTIIDEEGGVNYKGLVTVSKFKGNVSFSNCKKIQEEYGLDYQVDISITTSKDCDAKLNDIIKYDNIIFNVTDILKSDSHILIVGTKWQQ